MRCACKPLEEYAWFIEEIRKNNGSMEIEAAVDNALDAMPEDFALKQLLIANKAEVRQMCITEYNEAETMAQFKEEGREEGKEENALTMLRDNLALDKVALYSGVPMFRILELQKTLH